MAQLPVKIICGKSPPPISSLFRPRGCRLLFVLVILRHERRCIAHLAVTHHGIQEVLTAPRSPWQNAHVEHLIGSIRRECLGHVLIANERGLCRALEAYVEYYLKSRTHLSLNKDAPMNRRTTASPEGSIVAIPRLGGLHYHYERRAA